MNGHDSPIFLPHLSLAGQLLLPLPQGANQRSLRLGVFLDAAPHASQLAPLMVAALLLVIAVANRFEGGHQYWSRSSPQSERQRAKGLLHASTDFRELQYIGEWHCVFDLTADHTC